MRARKSAEPGAEALLVRIAKRDPAAVGQLYELFAPRLYAILRRILPDGRAAEATLEEVFLQLSTEARRMQYSTASLAAWLTLTARAAAVDHLRSGRKLPRTAGGRSVPLSKSLAWLPPAKEIALIEERRDLLRKVVRQLPVEQWKALELLVFEGYTEREIAERLGEPLAKIRSSLRASLTFLRHRLRAILGTWTANI